MVQPSDETALRTKVSAWLKAGLGVSEIERRLIEGGAEPHHAASVVNAVLASQVAQAAAEARRRTRLPLFGGIVLCCLGALLMIVGVLAFVEPDFGFPAHPGVFAGGASGVVAGGTLIWRAIG